MLHTETNGGRLGDISIIFWYEEDTDYHSHKNICFYEKQGYKIFEKKMIEPDFGMVFMEKFK